MLKVEKNVNYNILVENGTRNFILDLTIKHLQSFFFFYE